MKIFFGQRLYQSIIISISVIAFFVLLFWQGNMGTAVLQIGEKKVYVQIAKTIKQQRVGLGGRESLSPYGGMVFPMLPAKKAGMVMKDVLFPLDIIWTLDGVIIDIAPNVQPEPSVSKDGLFVYFPRKEANLVIEVRAGFIEQYNVKIGDSVSLIDE